MENFTPNKKVDLAVVSASSNHMEGQIAPSLQKDSRANIKYASSRDAGKLREFANRYNVSQITNEWTELLDTETDGLVAVATPTVQNQMALEALKMNKPVFIEKPPAMNRADMEKLAELSDENSDIPVMIDYNFIYPKLNQEAYQRLGKENIQTAYLEFITSKPTEPFYGFETVLETAIYSNFIHALAILIDLFGKVNSHTHSIQELKENRFIMTNMFTFENGKTATIRWGNASNQFISKCEFSTDEETVTINGLRSIESNKFDEKSSRVDKKGKEIRSNTLSYSKDSHEVAGYSKAVDIWLSDIQNKTNLSNQSVSDSIEMYRIIEEILSKYSK